jgi:hypothetical protein
MLDVNGEKLTEHFAQGQRHGCKYSVNRVVALLLTSATSCADISGRRLQLLDLVAYRSP